MLVPINSIPSFLVTVTGTPSGYLYSKNGNITLGPGGGTVSGLLSSAILTVSVTLAAGETDTLGELAILPIDTMNNVMGIKFLDIIPLTPGGDPWATPLPGAYADGQAGKILGTVVAATWATLLPGAFGAGTAGKLLGTPSPGGDPWATPLPGGYASGQAGKIVGDNLDASIKALAFFIANATRR